MQLQPGQVIAAKLRLHHQLGAGGMGCVWVADHLTLKTQVAVKFMATELLGNTEALARFSREAAAAARIKSPHVVRVFDYGVWEKTPYMVLELLEGEDLAARIRRAAPLDPREAALIVEQATRALEHAHAQGIVHRDIKPANIFLTRSGGELFVQLLDFGVAKAQGLEFSMKTETGAAVGTPSYMGPEQLFARGAPDARADLWSLAVVAYECVTGSLPFHGDTLPALGVAIHGGSFRPPGAFGRVVSPQIDAFFTRAFARDPGARFGSARELADAFAGAVRGGWESPSRATVPPDAPVSHGDGAPTRTLVAEAPSFAQSELSVPTLLAATVPAPPRARPAHRAPVVAGALVAIVLGAGGLLAVRKLDGRDRTGNAALVISSLPSPSAPPADPPAVPPAPSIEPVVTSPVAAASESAAVAPRAGSAHVPATAETARALVPPPGAVTAKPRRRDHGF